MRHGEVGHEDEPEFYIFSAFICHSLLPHPEYLWKKMFDQLTENCKLDKEEVRKQAKIYITEARKQIKKGLR